MRVTAYLMPLRLLAARRDNGRLATDAARPVTRASQRRTSAGTPQSTTETRVEELFLGREPNDKIVETLSKGSSVKYVGRR